MPHYISWNSSPIINTYLISTTGKKAGCVFQIPKTGNITNIYVSTLSGLTYGGVLNVGLFTVGEDGNPTTTPYGGSTPGQFYMSGNADQWVPLATPAAVVQGDIVAIVCESIAVNTRIVVNLGFLGTNLATNFPYTFIYTGLWTRTGQIPCFAVKYDDGTYPNMGGVAAGELVNETIGIDSIVNEIGMIVNMPVGVKINGVIYFGDTRNSYKMTLYDSDGTTILASTVNQVNVTGKITQGAVMSQFLSEITLIKNKDYFITLAPMTGNTIKVLSDQGTYDETPASRIMGSKWYKICRYNYGAWFFYTKKRAYLNFIVTYIDDSGTSSSGGTLAAAYIC